jgi:hypothetical protein
MRGARGSDVAAEIGNVMCVQSIGPDRLWLLDQRVGQTPSIFANEDERNDDRRDG